MKPTNPPPAATFTRRTAAAVSSPKRRYHFRCRRRPWLAAVAVAAAIGFADHTATAANGDWNIDNNTAGWSTATNWLGGVIAGGTAGDTANFNFTLTAARTIGLDGDRLLGTINMSGPAAFGYTLASNVGGALTLDNGAGTAAINFLAGSVAQTIQAPIVLNSNLEISSTIVGGHVVAGNITGGARSIKIDSNGSHPAGTTSGVGDIVFRGINSYTGGTTVEEARLQAYHSYAVGTGAVTVNNGGQVYMPSGGNWSNTFNLTGLGWNETTGILGALRVDANSVFTGTINIVASGPAPVARINAHAASTSLFNGAIAGGASDAMEFTTSAAVTSNFIINNTNTNAGTTRIGRATAAAGTTNVQIGNNNTSGALGSGDVTIDTGGVLVFNRTDAINFANNIAAGAGGLTQNGLGSVLLTGANILHSGTTTVNNLNGQLVIGAGGAVNFGGTGNIALSNLADIEFNTTSNVNLSGAFTSAKGSYLIQSGTGTTTLSGAADNGGGRAVVNAGTLVLGKASTAAIHALGGGGDIGLIITGGLAQLAGTGDDQLANTMVRMTGGMFDTNGLNETFDSLNGTAGTVTNSVAASVSTLTLGANNSASVFLNTDSTRYTASFGGVIQDGAGTVAITTSGSGIQTLTGPNTYSGPTTIGGTGTLAVNGSTLAAGAVTVGGGNLAGIGSVGNVTLTTGGIRPGATGTDIDAAGTLTMASLVVNGGDMRLNIGAASDLVQVTGAATLAAASTVTPLFTSAPGVAPVTILTSGALAPLPILPTLAGVPATTRGVFAVAQNGNNLELQNTGVAAQALTWSGGTGTWDLNITPNFTAGTATFFNLDSVTFTDASVGTVTLAAGTTFTPTGITDNTTGANNITLAGTGIIAGAAGITKTGDSTLTINTPNTFSGAVTVSGGGRLVAGNATALGNAVGETFISGGATLDINNQNLGAEVINLAGTGVGGNGALVNTSGAGQQQATRFITLTDDATVGGTQRFDIRTNGGGELLDLGGFTLTKTGSNQFSVVGVNVTSGNMVVDQGTLSLETSSVIQGAGTITANPGSTLAFYQTANGNITRPIVLDGATVDSFGQNNTVNSPVTASGAITFQGTGGTHNFTNSFTETAATSLTKNGAATFNVAGNVNYAGTTIVNQGALQLGILNAAAASAVNSVNVPGAATLGAALPNPGGTAGNLQLGTGGYTTITNAPSTITINNGTFGINTRVSSTIASNIVTNFFGGTNQINLFAPEQDTVTTLTGAVGSSTKFGRLNITGGTVNLTATSGLNLNFVELNNQNGAGGTGVGTSTATLNIQGGTHKVQGLYLGNASNSSGIVNMTGGTLTFEPNGAATLQDGNNSGYAMFGNDGLRIGHWTNGNSVPNQFNLSNGLVDAAQTTVSVGWDGSGFLNITGGTLRARTLYIDNGGTEGSPFVNRMDVSGGATIELGFGGMPTDGANTSINVGDSTWVAKASSDWTRGMNLTTGGTMALNTDLYRVGLTGQMVGAGNLIKTGTGILQVSGANIFTGALTANAGLLRMGNGQALGDGAVTVASGATLDINGQSGVAAAFRPASISFGGTGAAGSLGGLINSSVTTGGIGVDAGGTITISANTTVYAVGRLEIGTGGAGLNPIINGGANNVTKNGQNQLIWRGDGTSTIGNIVVNGGHFYAEEQDNNLGVGGTIIANPGGAFSAWQGDGTTSQSKAIVLNGGALMADRNSTWTGGLTVTADSLLTRNSTNADVALLFDNATFNLGGFTLTKRDRSGPTTIQNNTTSGNGTLDIVSGPVTLGANSVFDGTGKIKVRTDGSLIFADATASVTKQIELAGGSVTENLAGNVRNLATGGVNVISYGYLGALNATGTINPGAITLAPNAGLTFGSGTGYTEYLAGVPVPGPAMGAVSPTSITGGLATANPNLTVSSNTNATTGNDTTFATWTGAQYTGVAPTTNTIAGSVPASIVMVTAAEPAIVADTTIASLITEQTITITGATLTLNDGGLILRELGTGGWTGTGNLTSGRADGVLALTTTNHYDTVGAFTAGTISNQTISGPPAGFRPVVLVKNGPGNIALAANSTYTGGTIINSGRLNFSNPNAYGPGIVTIRDGGTVYAPLAGAYANTFRVSGIGMTEGAGVLGALRLNTSLTGCISLETATTRIHTHSGETGNILGSIRGANTLEKTGAGNLVVRSAVDYSGATILGNAGGNLANGTFTAFSLADGGAASSIGASGSGSANLVFHSGTLNYIGGGASTDRLFSVAPNTGNAAATSIGIANNGFGNLNFTNPGAIAMNNGATDVTLTLTANNYTANTFSPTLANPAGARLNLSVAGPGSWELNGASYDIAGTVNLTGGADLILNTAGDLTIPVFTTSGTNTYLVKNGANTLTLGGSGLLAEVDNASGMIAVNSGTVILDKRGNNAYTAGSAIGPGTGGAGTRALGGTGSDGLVLNGGTVLYSSTGNSDQIYDQVDVRINGGTLDLNGRSDTIDSLNGSGGVITNGAAGTVSILGVGANISQQAFQFIARADYGGVIQDGLGQLELVKAGNGVQVLSGANTYTGKTAILNGFLSIDSEDRLGVAPASLVLNQLTFSAPNATSGGGLETTANVTIDDPTRGIWLNGTTGDNSVRPLAGTTLNLATPVRGNGGLQMVGDGNLTLSGENVYTGTTAVYRGTLTLDYTAQNNSKLANGAALVLRGGNVVLSGGSHTEIVSGLTVEGNGQNAGSTYISRSGGTSVLNLNGLTRANGTIGGTLDIASAGIATTDTNNTNSIIAGAAGGGNSGVAYATFGRTSWATSVATGAADTGITGLATYQANNFATATNHVDVSGAQVLAADSTVSTLRFNDAGASSVGGAFTLTLNQQGILATPGSGAATINVTTLRGFAAPTAAITTDLVVHQHSSNPLTIGSIIANAVSGSFTNTTGLTKAGSGTLILTGANTYTGTTHINEGILELQGSAVLGNNVAGNAVWVDGTLSLNRAGNYTIANNMGGGGGGIIFKTNTGIATLSGGVGTYAGGAVVSQGTLVTTGDAFSNANQINDNPANATVYGTITLGDGNTGANNVAYLDGRGANHTIRKNIVITDTGSAGTAVVGAGTGAASKGNFNTIHQGNVQMNRTTTLRADTGDRLTFSGVLSGNVGTLTIDAPNIAGVVINTNPGRVTLENNNTFVGDVVINGAILQVGSGSIADPRDQIPDASNVTLNGVSAAKQAGLTLNGDSETINNLNGDVNTFIQSAASSSAQMMRLTVNGTGTFSGVFHGGNNTGMTLEKAGAGTFTLAGTADNPNGRILVSSGTLQLAKASSGSVHAAAGEVTITGGTLLLGGTGGDQIWDNTPITMYGGTFDLGGVNETIQSLYGSTGVVTNSSLGASTLTFGSNNGSSLFGGTIENGTGTVAIAKTGNGGAVFTGANTYSGATTITGGYVQIGNGGTTGSLGTGNVVTSANTQLVVNRSNNVTLANPISGGGSLVYNCGSGSTLTLTADNTYSGGTYISPGAILEIGNGGATGDVGTGNVTNYGEVRFNRNNALGVAAAIAGTGSVIQAGTGTTTLTANDTYTGATDVTDGKLTIDTTGTINSTSGVNIGAGEFNYNSATDLTQPVTFTTTGGTLSGTGTIGTAVNVTAGNIHAPGNSAGIQEFSNSLAYAANSSLQWQLMSNKDDATGVAGTDFDQVSVTGGTFAITTGAKLALTMDSAVDFTNLFWNSAHQWTIADLTGGVTGDGGTEIFTLDFTNIGGTNWNASYESRFTVTRVADANVPAKNDVVLKWAAAPGGYASWQAANGTAQAIGLDHDNDGVSNGVEFFLNGNVSTTGFTAQPAATITAGVLSITWTKGTGGSGYTGAYGPAADFVVETSTDLINWSPELAGFGTNVDNQAGYVKYTFPSPLAGKKFARLRVMGPP